MLRSDTDFGVMYTRSARILFWDTQFTIMLRFDTDFGAMYTRSARILLSDTHFAIVLCSDTHFGVMCTFCWSSAFRYTFRYIFHDTDLGVMYTCSARILLSTRIFLFCWF